MKRARPPRFSPAPRHAATLAALLLALAFAAFAAPTRAAPEISPAAELALRHDDNLGRASERPDRRDDTAVIATLSAGHSRAFARAWLATAGLAVRDTRWLDYHDFDQTELEARLSLRHRFGLGPAAPALTASLSGGPRFAAQAGRDALQGAARLAFSHRPLPALGCTFAAEIERIDATDTFFSATGRSLSAGLRWLPGGAWSLGLDGRHRFGDVLSFAAPPAPWRASTPYLASVPVRPEPEYFDAPLNAYVLEARTRSAALSAACALDDATTLALAFDYADTRRDGLRYLNRTFTLSLARRF